jgi:uncharacterized DUF497 family protein
MNFSWDENKAKKNQHKHGVSFAEASTVFGDPLSITIQDQGHSDYEERFVVIGCSLNMEILIVIHTDNENTIRIISARKATTKERSLYENI